MPENQVTVLANPSPEAQDHLEASSDLVTHRQFEVLLYHGDQAIQPHPVIAELHEAVGVHLQIYNGRQNFGNFDLIVFAIFDHALVKQAAWSGAGAMVLDVSVDQKEDLEDVVGTVTEGHSHAYFFRRNSKVYTTIYDLPSNMQQLTEGRDPEQPEPLNPDPGTFIWQVLDYITEAREGAVPDVPQWIADAESINEGPQPRQKHFTVHKILEKTIPNGWEGAVGQSKAQSGVTLTVVLQFSIFENKNRATGDYYLVFVNNASTVYPGKMVSNSKYTKGFIQFVYDASLVPSEHQSQWQYKDHSPLNINNEIEVTTSMEFKVGVDKDGFSGEHTYGNSVTEVIRDWEIIDKTRGLETSWHYTLNNPNPSKPFCSGWNVKSFPSLSTATLKVDTASLWRTNDLQTDPTWFAVDMKQYLRFYHVNFSRAYLSKAFLNQYNEKTKVSFNDLYYPD